MSDLMCPCVPPLYCPAATLHEFEGMSDLHRELATLRLSPADLQSSLAQAAKEAEEERRKGEPGDMCWACCCWWGLRWRWYGQGRQV